MILVAADSCRAQREPAEEHHSGASQIQVSGIARVLFLSRKLQNVLFFACLVCYVAFLGVSFWLSLVGRIESVE